MNNRKIKYVDLNGLQYFAEELKRYLESHVMEYSIYEELLERIQNLENDIKNYTFYEVVESYDKLLELNNPQKNIIYLVPDDNNFLEYIWTGNKYEQLGSFTPELKLDDYLKKEDSPFEKGSGENSAVLKGGDNQTTNVNEAAFGRFNKSNENTRFSIGMGTPDTDRKNAHEIMQDGKHYIIDIGGYDGTNPTDSEDLATAIKNLIEITYTELVNLRDKSKLVPGRLYRITDYKTTAYQYDRYCHAEVPDLHQFDIIVEAISPNTLSEKAKACRHTEDASDYFADSNLDAWEIWYDLDNNRDKYAWACDGSYVQPLESFLINGKWYNPLIHNGAYVNASIGVDEFIVCREQGDEHFYALVHTSDYSFGNMLLGTECRVYPGGLHVLGSNVETDLTTGYHTAYVDFICRENGHQLNEGTGIIYRMIDEFGNDCPYDFKNIQFARATVNIPNGVDADATQSRWLHNYMQVIYKNNSAAYSYLHAGNAIGEGYRFYEDEFADDDSVTVHGKGLIGATTEWFYTFHDTFIETRGDMSLKSYCYHNVMKPHIVTYRDVNVMVDGSDSNDVDLMVIKQTLNNNVFINQFVNSDVDSALPSFERYYYQCYNNRLEANCYMNTFGSGCYNLTMGENCHHNILGIDAADITMGKHNRYINLGNYCRFDVFDNYCLSIATANDFNSNKMGNASRFMSFKGDCSYNTFGINCMYLRFGEYCRYNQFGNYCNQNLFRDYMFTNTFGNYCNKLSLGTRWQYNTFGNNVTNIVIPTSGDYKNNVNFFYNNRFLDGLSYIAISATEKGDKDTPVTNYTFYPSLNGVEGSNTNLFKNVNYIVRTTSTGIIRDRIVYKISGGDIVMNHVGSDREGVFTSADAYCSHAEGSYTKAKASNSHAEGYYTEASGNSSHAEGYYTSAIVSDSHAEGNGTIANGYYSHAEGFETRTYNEAEHASGKYNKSTAKTEDNTTAEATHFSIGIGISDTVRKNAVEVKQNGDVYITGIGGFTGANSDSSQSVQEVINELVNKLNEITISETN